MHPTQHPLILPLDSPLVTFDLAGGKGANLTRLIHGGFAVPGGFIATTAAYDAYVAANDLGRFIAATAGAARPEDPATLEAASAAIRARFAWGAVPPALADALRSAYLGMDVSHAAVAVRSSATAEDLPDLSFAGQQDTTLNVVGEEGLLRAVVDCWSSLWTARAIGYRARNAIAHAEISMAVVVQAMVQSEAAGVLFTANPLTGKRSESVIDATFGLGEALVAGRVEPDQYVVGAEGQIVGKRLGGKALAIHGQATGGTVTVASDAAGQQALPDSAIGELVALGRRAEALFGMPQDIEWAWAEGKLWLLQARPITSLYPLPNAPADTRSPLHVYISFGALQGMLDPITPLGQDVMRLVAARAIAPFRGLSHQDALNGVPLHAAGERLWIDLTGAMRHSQFRRLTRAIPPLVEPASAQALAPLYDEPALAPDGRRLGPRAMLRLARFLLPIAARFAAALLAPDHRRRRAQEQIEAAVAHFTAQAQAAAQQTPQLPAWLALLNDISAVIPSRLFPQLLPAFAPGMATLNLLDHLASEVPDGSTLALEITRGLPHNVTTEMDLALWQTAQAIRAGGADPEKALEDPVRLTDLPGAQAALASFLARYGMRGVGEIDIGRRRWREDATPVWQAVASYLRISDPARAPDAVFERGAAAAQAALAQLTAALRRTRAGWFKARAARWAARRMRALAGLRESPKLTLIRLLGLLRAGLLGCGEELAATGVLAQGEDIFFLRLDELRELAVAQNSLSVGCHSETSIPAGQDALRQETPLCHAERVYDSKSVAANDQRSISMPRRDPSLESHRNRIHGTDPLRVTMASLELLQEPAMAELPDLAARVAERRQLYAREGRRRQVPRVILSDGRTFYEGISAPAGASAGELVGSPVSPGVAEGRVCVVFHPQDAQLAPGDILVCPGTDPAWTPLFLAAGGLVMEVGGLMTHGAVVAREYGIPAVVGVTQATARLTTGQRVRVDGTAGRVTVLE